MEKADIIGTLKTNYTRDLRKQVVKTLLKDEKENDKPNYQIIDQIFTYVQRELGWKLPENEEAWDYTPLDVMKEAFPHIESTKWYEIQIYAADQVLDAMKKNEAT